MSTIASLTANESGSSSRTDINTNFSNLNTDKMEKSNNLSDVTSAATARTNLGLGTAAVKDTGTGSGNVILGNDARLTDSRTPTTHATSHQSGGSDAIKLDDLAAGDDNTDLNVSSSKHGLMVKLPNDATKVFLGDGSYGTPPGGAFVAGVISDLVTTSAGNNDSTVTTSFTPRLIILHYFLQAFDGSGATGFIGRKGIAVYNGTTLVYDDAQLIAPDATTKLSGDNGTFPAATAALQNTPNSTAAPTASATNTVVLSIASISSTTCVIRRATTIGDGSKNCRAKVAYQIFA